jgi:hypothetical protein
VDVDFFRRSDISVLPWLLLLFVLAWGVLGFISR